MSKQPLLLSQRLLIITKQALPYIGIAVFAIAVIWAIGYGFDQVIRRNQQQTAAEYVGFGLKIGSHAQCDESVVTGNYNEQNDEWVNCTVIAGAPAGYKGWNMAYQDYDSHAKLTALYAVRDVRLQ